MARRRKAPIRSRSRPVRSSAPNGSAVLVVMIGFLIVILYLWARVQVEEVLRETDKLTQEKLFLEQKVNDLDIQINAMRGYERIAREARKQGLILVRSRDIDELPVDLSGLPVYTVMPRAGWQQAGMQPVSLKH
jgi:cell division protein FtsL